MESKGNLIVLGHGRHGKDQFCEHLGVPFVSSSMQAAEHAVMPFIDIPYESILDCYNDRSNHRASWHRLISEYNTPDKTRLAREIYKRGTIYNGMRCKYELAAVKAAGLVDLVVWIEADKRMPLEDPSSISVTKDMADIIIENQGSLDEFLTKIDRIRPFLT